MPLQRVTAGSEVPVSQVSQWSDAGLYANLATLNAYTAPEKPFREVAEEAGLIFLSDLAEKLRKMLADTGAPTPILSDVSSYLNWRKDTIAGIQRDIQASPTQLKVCCSDADESGSGAPTLDDREAFLRQKAFLLANYRDMFVAFADGRLIAADESFDELGAKVRGHPEHRSFYVELVEEAAFEEPPAVEIPGLFEVLPAGDATP